MKLFWKNNALSVVLLLLFFTFWFAQTFTGRAVHNQELGELGQRTLGLGAYLASGHFWSATAENWESEFLQMASYVVLTVHLRQRGSAESSPYPDELTPEERERARRDEQVRGFWKRNSLTLTLLGLFVLSFVVHLFGSWRDTVAEQLARGQAAPSLGQFLGEPEFWFESFQNWQSEFLAVAAIVVLTIFLRQIGSSQSKALTDPDDKTGD